MFRKKLIEDIENTNLLFSNLKWALPIDGLVRTPFFYHLSSSSRYLTKNILCLVIQIRKLFYFGLKFSVKSAYKTNTLC